MKRYFPLGVFSLLLISSAFARTAGPCAGGPNPLFRVKLDSTVTLDFEHFKPMTTTAPSVHVDGNTVTVTQIVPAAAAPAALCNVRTVSLGALSPGKYHVAWNYRAERTPAILQTFSFDFDVPEPAAVNPSAVVVTPVFDPRVLAGLIVVVAAAGVWALRR